MFSVGTLRLLFCIQHWNSDGAHLRKQSLFMNRLNVFLYASSYPLFSLSSSKIPHHKCFLFVLGLFFFAFPSYTSGVHHFWVRFLRMWLFFNPTIKVVTFRLRGWCVLGVFLLPAFTRLGHERQDLLSPCDEMHVCKLNLSLYSHPKEFLGEWSLNPC